MINWQVQSFRVLHAHRTAKTLELAHQKTFFAFKILIHDFHEENNLFHLNSYVATIGINVIIIIIGVAQQQKRKFSLSEKLSFCLVNFITTQEIKKGKEIVFISKLNLKKEVAWPPD